MSETNESAPGFVKLLNSHARPFELAEMIDSPALKGIPGRCLIFDAEKGVVIAANHTSITILKTESVGPARTCTLQGDYIVPWAGEDPAWVTAEQYSPELPAGALNSIRRVFAECEKTEVQCEIAVDIDLLVQLSNAIGAKRVILSIPKGEGPLAMRPAEHPPEWGRGWLQPLRYRDWNGTPSEREVQP